MKLTLSLCRTGSCLPGLSILIALSFLASPIFSQNVYTITADSVKLTSCDSSELIIMNHTQNVPGFLFNAGNGRTAFHRGAQKLNDSLYLIGADTIDIPIPNTNFWSLTGNANTSPSANYLGTADANPVIFRTYGAEQMRLFVSGNLGLGTYGSDAGYKLQVIGDDGIYAPGSKHIMGNIAIASGSDVGDFGIANGIRADAGIGGTMIFEGNTQGWAYDMFTFTTAYGNLPKGVYNNGSIVKIQSGFSSANVGSLSGNTLFINPTYNVDTTAGASWPMTLRGIYYNPILTNIAGSRHIAIETTTGDVLLGTTSGNTGIGTSLPTAQLHTTGSVRFAGLTSDSTQTNVLVSDASGNLYLRSVSSLAANDVIRSSLAVNGPIKARRLTLSSAEWPDYVFDSSYRLPLLPDVENYIRRQHHLPGVAPAAEVQKAGADVGDTQAVLLKKVEELTLYTIQQSHEIESLKKEMTELRQLITSQSEKR